MNNDIYTHTTDDRAPSPSAFWRRLDGTSPTDAAVVARLERLAEVRRVLITQPDIKAKQLSTMLNVTRSCAGEYLRTVKGEVTK